MTDTIDNTAENRVVSETAAAEFLGLSVDTLRRVCMRGEGPPRLRLSPRRVGYRLRDLDAWLNERPR
jgi:prophage regulatory protein